MVQKRRKTRKTKEIHDFILRNVSDHPKDIGQITARQFGITRQSVSGHLNSLAEEDLLLASGMTRARRFDLKDYIDTSFEFDVSRDLKEDVIWRDNIRPHLKDIKENVLDILHIGLTEMVNNVIDHSESNKLTVFIFRNAMNTTLVVRDYGIGIFKKIQEDFNLDDPRHSLLELSKGKLTSDDSKHTGEGIFFSSRMFDTFIIWSERLMYSCSIQNNEWLTETENKDHFKKGTLIIMEITEDSDRTSTEIYDKYTSEYDDYGFTKTHIPLELLRYEGEKLISRSQAKRLLARVDKFNEVLLDFRGVKDIGQSFADEIFRVYKQDHPGIIILTLNTTPEINKMINRVAPPNGQKSQTESKA